MTTVVGWDLSFNPGVARITTTPGYLSALGEVSDTEPRVHTWRFASTGKKGDALPARTDRIIQLRNQVLSATLGAGPVDLIVIEGPTYGRSDPYSWDRGGLWHACCIAARQQGIPVTLCFPGTLKKITTGNGAADKAAMVAKVSSMWKRRIDSDDEADALALATVGAVHLRLPVPFIVTEDYRLAMAGLDLPERPPR